RLEAVERLQARAPARLLDARSRAIVERVASDVCAYRGWDMFAANARTNHVHLVIATGCAPEDLVRSLKRGITRRLVASRGGTSQYPALVEAREHCIPLGRSDLATRPCTTWCTVKTSGQARFDELNLTAP
ncbi:MAG TPA: hypothetical protein VN894_15860, partial [Polyangiaceae bacterium]|nr:hypothetical protein [Polyangiaceae bacterium]